MNTFEVTYLLTMLEGGEVDEKIESLCLEQSVELPRSLLDSKIEQEIVGSPVAKKEVGNNQYEVTIAWPVANLGGEITQFLNVLYGNISLQPGIRILDAEWKNLSPDIFGGPAFGISKIREQYDIIDRPLSAAALKPVGSTPSELADFCYQFASGGIDIIKDDHGLANQEAAPFQERIKACIGAIQKAAEKTGRYSYYYPNITASSAEVVDRYQQAAKFGADGVLLCPHISGLETMHRLARMNMDLPIIAHPAFSGQLTRHDTKGLSPDFLYGQMWRALGADFVIYPNKGGRFSFTTAECEAINKTARNRKSVFQRSFPMPGGGIKINGLGRWISEYDNDAVFLIGGSLYEHPDGIRKAAKKFRNMLIKSR